MPVTAGQTTPVVRCLDPPATPPRPEIRARALSRRSALRAMVAACGSAVGAGCAATTSGQARPPATRTRTPLRHHPDPFAAAATARKVVEGWRSGTSG
jgi:hypothetical protein